MDEPLSNLDAKLRVQMRRDIRMLQQDLGITTIYVTHDQVEAMSLSDRITIMHEGKIMQIGTQDEIYSYPNNKWVAGFIGAPAMNFLDCNLEEKEGAVFLAGANFMICLPKEMGEIVKAKSTSLELILGIRPEHATLTKEKNSDSIEGVLELLELLGENVLAAVNVEGSIFKVKLDCNFKMELRTKVFIVPDMNSLHVFDKKTEEAIR
jgi:multiple sugar transport system ATP-binding protein